MNFIKKGFLYLVSGLFVVMGFILIGASGKTMIVSLAGSILIVLGIDLSATVIGKTLNEKGNLKVKEEKNFKYGILLAGVGGLFLIVSLFRGLSISTIGGYDAGWQFGYHSGVMTGFITTAFLSVGIFLIGYSWKRTPKRLQEPKPDSPQ